MYTVKNIEKLRTYLCEMSIDKKLRTQYTIISSREQTIARGENEVAEAHRRHQHNTGQG